MSKYNVKKIDNTNTMTTTLTTSCVKRDTAINRFCRFLSEYDSCFKDSLLIATAHICYAGDCNNIVYKAVSESDEYILTYTEYTPTDDDKNNVVFTVIIEFKHDDNTTNDSTDNTKENDNKTVAGNADGNDNTTPLPCYIKAYDDIGELTVPCNVFKCAEYAIEYITSLYKNHVVSYDTVFVLKCGSQAKEYTIHTLIAIPYLIQYNIDCINVGLKTDYYKKVREGVERLCALIDDNHVCVVGFKCTTHTFDYSITKSKTSGWYNFKRGNNNWIQKPSEIARFLYYHTFAHEVIFKYWHMI